MTNAPRLLQFVEIDVDRCSNTYKVLPCMAFAPGDVNPEVFGHWFGNNQDNGWTASSGTLTTGADGLEFTETGSNAHFTSPGSLGIETTNIDYIIEIDWVRETAGTFEGHVYYTTAAHSFSDSFRAAFTDTGVGVRTTTRIDMSALDVGGNDFITHTVNQLRIDFDSGAAGKVKIFSIKWGKVADATDGFDHKCFNSLKSCQFRPQLTPQVETLRFAVPADYLPLEIDCIPSVTGISFSPGTISLGEDLGQRATMTISFIDHPHPDTGVGGDRYVSERSYDPYKQGTYWGKFRARYPYLVGRPLRVIRGLVGQDLADMDTRYYIIDSFDGPKPDGSFSIIAKDVLKLADDDKSQAPLVSEGFLAGDISSTTTSITMGPTGVGALYPTSGLMNIGGSEIVSFTRSGDVLTATRGQANTVATSHNAQDRCQICLQYSAASPAAIIADLLTNYANIPSSFIPLSDWENEITNFLAQSYTAIISDPVGVNTLISELVEQAALAVWWDDSTQKIRLQVLRTISKNARLIDEDTLEGGSAQVQEQPELRISQVWTYYALINPLVDLTETSNYRSVELLVDGQRQSDYGTPAIKQIFSRWIPQFGRSVASKLNQTILGQYKDPPRKINFQLFGQQADVTLGAGYNMQFRSFQDEQGLRETVPIQITRLDPSPDHYKIEAQEALFTDLSASTGIRTIVIDTNVANFNLKTVHDTLFPPFTDPTGITINCVIQSGVFVYSNYIPATSLPAFSVGNFPSGTNIIINLDGAIQGGGGLGGQANGLSMSNGFPGGTALHTTLPITITCTNAGSFIFGGGGGGGAFAANSIFGARNAGGGGGGGLIAGPGGSAVNASFSASGSSGSQFGGGVGGSISGVGAAANGGGVGAAGGNSGSLGGAAGISIDGISHITFTDLIPSILGPQIN